MTGPPVGMRELTPACQEVPMRMPGHQTRRARAAQLSVQTLLVVLLSPVGLAGCGSSPT
jgi:surfactin synthase thioesterase subunit